MNNAEIMKQVYLLAQEHCGLKVGDWVKVVRKAEDYEAGWAFEWLRDADKTIGKFGKICDIRPVGIEVSFTDQNFANYWYPYFILEKVEKPAHEFKPFDKVLVRVPNMLIWMPAFYAYKTERNNFPYITVGGNHWSECIPYEGNEHLVGTTNMPEE